MSNPSFDTMETTLKSLKDIVDRNHSGETSQLVENMELLIAEIKSKSKVAANEPVVPVVIIPTPVVSFSV